VRGAALAELTGYIPPFAKARRMGHPGFCAGAEFVLVQRVRGHRSRSCPAFDCGGWRLFYAENRRRTTPMAPSRPVPKRARLEGSGTALSLIRV